LKTTQIYYIILKAKAGKTTPDQRHLNAEKTKSLAFVADIAIAIKKERRVTIRNLALAHGVSTCTIQNTLHKDLNMVKKNARWVPKLLNDQQKRESEKLQGLLGDGPPTLQGDIGQYRHYGRIRGKLPHHEKKQQSNK
jgi:hypothetical protein